MLKTVTVDSQLAVNGLFCKNEDLIKKHSGKVYSKAGVGSPPMSVPHLDTRFINGKKELMFGPFAGFSTRFLKEGFSNRSATVN